MTSKLPTRRLGGLEVSAIGFGAMLDQDAHAVPIPGSRTPAHIEENLAAGSAGLPGDVRERLAAVLAATEVAGGTLL
ncbi:hypothetical protein [Streptomyces zhihengii]